MAKPAQPRAPKVYAADIDGVHEWIVAAPNQRAALDALGVHQDLFAQGKASVEEDPAKVEAARSRPGVPLRRAKGSKGAFEPADEGGGDAWLAALSAAPKPGKASAKSRAGAKAAPAAAKPAKSEPAAHRPAAPKGPSAADRMALRGAEAQLRAFERDAVKETAELDAEQTDLDRRRYKLERDQERRRAELQKIVDKARAVVEG